MSEKTEAGAAKAVRGTGVKRAKVPEFARYEGTSAFRKYRQKVRAYAWFKAQAKKGAA